MKIQESLKQIVSDNMIQDIKTWGLFDLADGIGEFIPQFKFLYLCTSSGIIAFESIEQYSKLKISCHEKIQLPLELEFIKREEDLILTILSISELILVNPMADNLVDKMEIFNYVQLQDEIHCDSLNVILKNKQNIFLDPTFLQGIKIGGIEQYKFWIENIVEHMKRSIPEKTIIEFTSSK
ncbi:hypothetical protein [Leptospira weilii]|uniref:hypothetical protein n=1 Tax=Leptospira weilii TaxID=28184 RepID=UPI000774BC89|nr:hypothetical protein [Leptospira weilii]